MFHRTILIDFDLKIIICHAEIACTNFKYFEGIKKYRSEVLILKYRYRRLVLKLGIEKY